MSVMLETHLGVAAKALGFKVATPVLMDRRAGIRKYLTEAKKVEGFTWVTETASRRYTMEDRRRFRSKCRRRIYLHVEAWPPCGGQDPCPCCGPYSLVTQQPLGGKLSMVVSDSGNGGLGAGGVRGSLYASGTANCQVRRRSGTRIYESIVKGDNSLEAGTPESFNVLIKEMQSLGLTKVGGRTQVFGDSALDTAQQLDEYRRGPRRG